MGCFNASLGANDLLRGGRCCRSGGHVAAIDVTGLTNLEGSASSSLDDLGERLLAGGTGKLMGRSRCEGSEDSGAWGSRVSSDFGLVLVQVVRFHGLFRERRDEKMADFSFFVAAESFKLVKSLDSTTEIKKARRIERCQVSWQE